MLQQFIDDSVLALTALLFTVGVGAVISLAMSRLGGYFAEAVAPGNKLVTIEGFRGILALSVALHHACCWYFYMKVGSWGTGHSIMFDRFGSFGVTQFFFISGYLFWRKLMRNGSISMGRFYFSRFLRIAPVYYVCMGTAIAIGLVVAGPGLHVERAELVRSLLAWSAFTAGGIPSVNGADVLRITCGVTWTLALEWGFYLLLPLLAWFSRGPLRLVWLALSCGLAFLISKYASDSLTQMVHFNALLLEIHGLAKFMLVGFGGGILIATFEPTLRRWNRLTPLPSSWLLLGACLAYLSIPGAQSWGELFLLVGFTLVVQGTDLFGFLSSRGVRLLGIVSYDLYVVHGIVYYVATRLRGGIHPVPLWVYLPETGLCLVAIVVVSTLLHLGVERPSMLLSERVGQYAGKRSTKLAPNPATV
jgi:peptidoglycan/LPS O-acetylase OafA/YrhL